MPSKSHIKFKILISIMRFIYIGIKSDNEGYLKDKIKISNFITLSSIFAILFTMILYAIIGSYNALLGSILHFPGIFLGVYFTKIHYYTFAKVFSVLHYNLCILLIIIYYSHPVLNYFYIPLLIALPMVFHYKEIKTLFVLSIITLLLFAFCLSPLSIYIPKYYKNIQIENAAVTLQIALACYSINLVAAFVIYTQISHNRLRKISERLIKSRKKLILQNQDIQTFSTASSQFIKSPIYVLNLFTDKIEKEISEGKMHDDLKEYFDIVQDSVYNGEIFIDNLFDYNKVITSITVFEKFDLKTFLEEELNAYQKLAFKININEATVVTDKELLRKIVLVIFENSFNYNLNLNPKINIYTIEDKKSTSIYFSDNGIGISSDFSDKIFEPFIRVNQIQNINGTGMGLAKAKKAAEMLNAGLSLFKSSEKGSVFKLIINKPTTYLRKTKK